MQVNLREPLVGSEKLIARPGFKFCVMPRLKRINMRLCF